MMRFNRGDASALRDIYGLYKDDLVTLASALLHDKTSAEDAVHDVFAKLLDRQKVLKISQSLRQYLMTAVANSARQRYRLGIKATEAFLDSEISPEPQTQSPPESAMLIDEQQQYLTSALSALPYEQREVILLRHYSDLKFRTIASMLNVSINTIQGRYRYGLDKLRSLLNGELL